MDKVSVVFDDIGPSQCLQTFLQNAAPKIDSSIYFIERGKPRHKINTTVDSVFRICDDTCGLVICTSMRNYLATPIKNKVLYMWYPDFIRHPHSMWNSKELTIFTRCNDYLDIIKYQFDRPKIINTVVENWNIDQLTEVIKGIENEGI